MTTEKRTSISAVNDALKRALTTRSDDPPWFPTARARGRDPEYLDDIEIERRAAKMRATKERNRLARAAESSSPRP